jgi:localization factor PodJL
MTSGVPWQVKGVRREAIDTAREAARRSGLSVAEWLDSVITQSAREAGVDPTRNARSQSHGKGDDSRNWRRRQSNHDDRHRPQEPDLNDVNARIDALSRQVGELAGQSRRVLDRALGRSESQGAIPTGGPGDAVDQALAEIEARQRALEGGAGTAPPMNLARAPTQRLPDLEHQLRQINQRIDTMRSCGLDRAVDTLRDDLAEIGVMLKDAMPRQAIEALESEVRSLTARIDNKRHAGADGVAIAGVERGLAEVRDALRGLTPAENLTGFDETVQGLSQKIDRLAGTAQDPAALRQLEGAIAALRGVVSHTASNDALATLSEEVRGLSAKVDQVTASDAFSTIERRIASIADTLQSRDPAGQNTAGLEAVVHSLADKIERLQSVRSDHGAASHLEERIVQLVERLDASDARLNHLHAIERGLADLLIHIENHRMGGGAALESPNTSALQRDVQRTQDSLETVHGTLGHVVDRLATIETSIRSSQLPRAANIPEAVPALAPAPATSAPTPVAATPGAAELRSVPAAARAMPLPSEDDGPRGPTANPSPAAERRPIDPDLPPDHPLEPGDVRARGGSSPSERIAASEAALENVRPPVIPDPGGKSNFIAAARRAAQAAMVEAPPQKEKSAPAATASGAVASIAGKLGGKPRKAFVAIGAVLFILGSLHFVVTRMWSSGTPAVEATAPATQEATPPTAAPGGSEAPAPRTAPDRQSAVVPPGFAGSPGPLAAVVGAPNLATAETDTTGTVRQRNPQSAATPPAGTMPLPQPSPVRSNGADRLPAAIGSGGLRAAAAKGDPGAEFEIATRYADGRGVPQNLTEAAAWFERAANQGLVPAQFRLGGLHEKGMGVRKDVDTARRLYVAAAEAGHAKAMHNLAVLHAEGVGGKPDYQTAARWFRKAADHGVVDSQYNLAILYARGIGVETNLAEAFKWFSLASREGDREAARRRDDVAGRLDKPSLTAAMAAAQAWQAQPQPDAAVQVRAPTGGWDGVPTPSTAKRRVGPKIDTSTRRPAQ